MKNTPEPPAGKSLHSFIILVLIVGLAGLAAWVIQLRSSVDSLKQQLADVRKGPTSASSAINENKTLRARVAELEAQAAAPAAAPRRAAAAPPAAPAAANPLAAALAATMNNPAMQKLMSDATKRGLETRYADLIASMQLSTDDRAKFIDLLAAKSDAPRDASLKLVSGNMSASERTALVQQIKDGTASAEANVRDFLGEANYADYQAFNQAQTDKTQAATLNAPFTQAGEPLSADQSGSLASLMAEERKAFVFTNDLKSDDTDPAVLMNSQAVDTYFKEQEELQNRIASRAANVLTPTQLAVFQKNQENQLEAMKTSLNLVRAMMGGAAPATK